MLPEGAFDQLFEVLSCLAAIGAAHLSHHEDGAYRGSNEGEHVDRQVRAKQNGVVLQFEFARVVRRPRAKDPRKAHHQDDSEQQEEGRQEP